MSPVVAVTDTIPRRNENASTGVIRKIKGSINASVVGPPRPGRIPTPKPTVIPKSMSPKAGHVNTWVNPRADAWKISNMEIEFPSGAGPRVPRQRVGEGRGNSA